MTEVMKSSPERQRIRAILFDLDDTLLDWSTMAGEWRDITRQHLDNVHDHLSSADHQLPDKETFFNLYVEIVIQSWDDAKVTWAGVHFADVLSKSFEELGLNLNRIDLTEVMVAYDWQPMPGVRPYDDAISVLGELQRRGYKLGLVTNSMFPMWMRDIELKAYDLIDYFAVRITSGEARHMKPHPAIFQRALQLLKTVPEQAMFVGDRPANDIAGANESGLVSVLMAPSHLNRGLDGVRPDYTIASLSELLPILGELEQGNGVDN
jgi:HAD superfamily hydrolase (TIGR01509 family)